MGTFLRHAFDAPHLEETDTQRSRNAKKRYQAELLQQMQEREEARKAEKARRKKEDEEERLRLSIEVERERVRLVYWSASRCEC